jgi:anti-sigma-K factor RskA
MSKHSKREWNDDNDRIRAALDRSVASVEQRHGDRLADARRAALAARSASAPSASRWTVMLPVAASVAVVALTATLLLQAPQTPEPMPMTVELDLLVSDAFDLALEDPEFVAWLAEQELDDHEMERSG